LFSNIGFNLSALIGICQLDELFDLLRRVKELFKKDLQKTYSILYHHIATIKAATHSEFFDAAIASPISVDRSENLLQGFLFVGCIFVAERFEKFGQNSICVSILTKALRSLHEFLLIE
jgi:hypothetical protein